MSIATQDTQTEWFRIILFIILFFICIAFKPSENLENTQAPKIELSDISIVGNL